MRKLSESRAEKSSGKRLRHELHIYYGPSQQILLHGYSVDLSEGGLYLKTEIPFDVDETLLLRFTPPNEERVVSCQARVAWVNSKETVKKAELPQGVGLQFVDISTEDLSSVRRVIEKRSLCSGG